MDTVIIGDSKSKDHVHVDLRFTKTRRQKPSNRQDFKEVTLELLDGAWRSDALPLTQKVAPIRARTLP